MEDKKMIITITTDEPLAEHEKVLDFIDNCLNIVYPQISKKAKIEINPHLFEKEKEKEVRFEQFACSRLAYNFLKPSAMFGKPEEEEEEKMKLEELEEKLKTLEKINEFKKTKAFDYISLGERAWTVLCLEEKQNPLLFKKIRDAIESAMEETEINILDELEALGIDVSEYGEDGEK